MPLIATGAGDALCFTSANGAITYNSGQTTCLASALKYKENISRLTVSQTKKLMNIPVNTYNYIGKSQLRYGLIAEDVREQYPELARYNKDGSLHSYEISDLVPIMLKGMQEQQTQINQMGATLCALGKPEYCVR